MLEPSIESLSSTINLEIDGKNYPIPEDIQGLIITNVLTYAGIQLADHLYR